jgi:hypothetical protein
MECVSMSDERTIAWQIGRKPRGLSGVASRCSYGFPQVVRVHPVVDGEPFPTLYWLTCPYLASEIDRLESDGWVGRIEARLSRDRDLFTRYRAAVKAYVRSRLDLLSDEDLRYLRGRGMLASLTQRGIGGIAERQRVKCLHLHAADALASSNPIGEVVLDMLERRECRSEKVICSTLERVEQIEQINR